MLSFFITGAAQFLAGHRLRGIAWFSGITLVQLAGALCLASRWVPGVVPGFAIGAAAFVLWIVMLVKSYRPVPRLRARTWLVFIPLIVVLPLAQREFAIVFIQPFSMPTGGMAPTIQGITTVRLSFVRQAISIDKIGISWLFLFFSISI